MSMSLLETYECKCCGPVSVFIERQEGTGLFYYEKKVGRKIHEDKVPTHDGTGDFNYYPDWDNDSTYWHKYEKLFFYDYPDTIKCPKCNKKTGKRASIYYFSVGNGRNSYAAMKERRRYAVYGMDKVQAEQFYKESIEASKERQKTGGQHYKKVSPDYEQFRAEGKAVRLTDQETAEKIQRLKNANIQLTKDGKIGQPPRKQ